MKGSAQPITPEDRPSSAFVQVTPGLVRKLGAVRALVWARIDWRTNEQSFAAVDPDQVGERWWTADVTTIAAETGLSRSQVKNAVVALALDGHLESRQFRKKQWDRIKSYRTRVSAPSDSGHSNCTRQASLDRPNSDALPLRPTNTSEKDLKGHPFGIPHENRPASPAQNQLLSDMASVLQDPEFNDLIGADLTVTAASQLIDDWWTALERALYTGDFTLSDLSPRMLGVLERRNAR